MKGCFKHGKYIYRDERPRRLDDDAMYKQVSFVSSEPGCERRAWLWYTYPANTSVPSGLLRVNDPRHFTDFEPASRS
jgi:hypothetical protein